jgi:hypothetical protein
MVTVQLFPLVESHPLQLPNVEGAIGDATRVTTVLAAIEVEQIAPQSIPPPLTVPDPLPCFCTRSVWDLPGLNVAVTCRSAFMVTVQLFPLVESHPLQLPKVEGALADAVNVTTVPPAIDALQLVPQSIAPPFTLPEPVPAFRTVSEYFTGSYPPHATPSDARSSQLAPNLVRMMGPQRSCSAARSRR